MTETSTWLEAKRHGLTGTDAAAIVGASPWKTPYAVWADKTGKLDREDLSCNEVVHWGNVLEPVVIAEYAERTGRKIQYDDLALSIAAEEWPECTPRIVPHDDGSDRLMLVNDAVPVLRCTPDFGIDAWKPLPDLDVEQAQHDGPGIGEAKTGSAWVAGDWTDGPPLQYQIQVQHMLLVSGLQWGSIPVLLGGSAFRIVDMPRDDAFLEHLLNTSGEFWDKHVIPDIPPELMAQDLLTVKRMHPKDDGSTIALPEYVKDLDARREALAVSYKADGTELELLEAQIRRYIGTSKLATVTGTKINYTLNTTKNRGSKCPGCDHQAREPYSYRQLRRKVVTTDTPGK